MSDRKSSLARATQLTQKAGQFNATTHRYTEADIEAKLSSGDWEMFTATLADRFGDGGGIGLAMAEVAGETLDIDTFRLSSRVAGRTIMVRGHRHDGGRWPRQRCGGLNADPANRHGAPETCALTVRPASWLG